MSKPLFVVPVADLESGEKHRRWELPREWLSRALEGSEALPRDGEAELDVMLGLNGREVMVRGHLRAPLVMPCARTLDPVDVDVDASVFLLLEPPSPTAGAARRRRPRTDRKRQAGKKDEDKELAPEEAARDGYDGEQVVLDDFAREFLLLELPMFPLRSDLRSEETPSISGAPDVDAPNADEAEALDPRLAPLAEIARRLRDKE